MPIDHRDVLPGNGIEAVRHRLQGDRQRGCLLLVHHAVVVIHPTALGIEHLDRTEAWRNLLTKPEGQAGRRLMELGVRLRHGPEKVCVGTYTLCHPQWERCYKS